MVFTGIAVSLAIGLTGSGIVGCIRWLKGLRKDITTIKDNHLQHIQTAMESLPEALEKQTTAIVSSLDDVKIELREQRQDIRNVMARL